MNIQIIGTAHSDVLASLHQACFDEPWTPSSFTSALTTPGTLAWLAQDKSDYPLGMVMIRASGEDGEILTIATTPQARRQGVARALMQTVLETARTSPIKKLFLDVAVDNQAALNLYTNLGFTPVGHRPAYYARPHTKRVDATVMAINVGIFE